MRQFYLSKNSCGYYRVHFIDPVTGVQSNGKSTHSKDRVEATMIATSWLTNGTPEARGNSRAFHNSEAPTTSAKLISFIDNLSESDALKVVEMISKKFNLDLSASSSPEPVEVPVSETAAADKVTETSSISGVRLSTVIQLLQNMPFACGPMCVITGSHILEMKFALRI